MKEITIDNLLEKATRSELIQLIKMFISGLENSRRMKNYYSMLCEKYEDILLDAEINKAYKELDKEIEKDRNNFICDKSKKEYSKHSLKLALCLSRFFGCEMFEELSRYTGVPVEMYEKLDD